MTLTVRETILEYIKAQLATMQAGSPGGDPYSVTWGKIRRAPLTEADEKVKYAIAIHEGAERKQVGVGYYLCTLPIVLEFREYIEQAENPSQELNRVLGDLQRFMSQDNTLGGNAINCIETGNDMYIDNDDTRRGHGALMLDITYRHSIKDPRVRV